MGFKVVYLERILIARLVWFTVVLELYRKLTDRPSRLFTTIVVILVHKTNLAFQFTYYLLLCYDIKLS